MLHLKLPPVARESSGDGAFVLSFERDSHLTPALFRRADLRGLAVGRHLYCKKFKKISIRNLPNVGMGGWMDTG